ncbi:hypothetical protein K2X40_04615 [Candidatus Babeliales bacterium]|nr:hypothetical protein [Candidatus Babeliales bacterium]
MSKKLMALVFSFGLVCSTMNADVIDQAGQVDVLTQEEAVLVEALVEQIKENVKEMEEAGLTEQEIVEHVATEIQEIAAHGFAGLRNKEKGIYFVAGVGATLAVAAVVFAVKKFFFDKAEDSKSENDSPEKPGDKKPSEDAK